MLCSIYCSDLQDYGNSKRSERCLQLDVVHRIKLKTANFRWPILPHFTCGTLKEQFSPSLLHMKSGADAASERLWAF